MPDPAELVDLCRELAEPLPHPDPADCGRTAAAVVAWILEQAAGLGDRAPGTSASPAELAALLRETPPDAGRPFDEVLGRFRDAVAPFVVRLDHPRCVAFVPGAPVWPSILGDLLASGMNVMAGRWAEAAGPAQVELVVLDWFADLLGYGSSAGLLTSGGSESNLTALVLARNRLAVEDRHRAVAYFSEYRHGSLDRGGMVIGLRPDQLRVIPADHRGRCLAGELPALVARDRAAGHVPFLVVANAGATATGAVDPLAEVAATCRAERLWLHVDAAYGWAAALCPAERPGFAGIADADSVTLDPHKWFGQTFDVGCLLVRDPTALERTFTLRDDYLAAPAAGDGPDVVDFADRGLALSRRFRALKVWLSVQLLGIDWFRRLAARSCKLARLFEVLIGSQPGFEVVSGRQLSVVCFRYHPGGGDGLDNDHLDHLNNRLAAAVRADGRAYLATARVTGRVVLRVCFVNWRTTADDVRVIVAALADCAAGLADGPPTTAP